MIATTYAVDFKPNCIVNKNHLNIIRQTFKRLSHLLFCIVVRHIKIIKSNHKKSLKKGIKQFNYNRKFN